MTLWPWQIVSKYLSLKFIYKLNIELDFKKILSEFEEVKNKIALQKHFGPYHDGGWSGIALYSVDGNSANLEEKSDEISVQTEISKYFPYTISIVEKLKKKYDCKTSRVRFLNLKKGRRINWHYDWDESITHGNCRLHIPIKINSECYGEVCHQHYQWEPGEIWYGDFSFPHKVRNLGLNDRIHLVIDLKKPKGLFEDNELFKKEELKRTKFKKLIIYIFKLTYYYPRKCLSFNELSRFFLKIFSSAAAK